MMGPASCWQRHSSSCRVSLTLLQAHLPRHRRPQDTVNLDDFQTTQSFHRLGTRGDGAGLPDGAQAPPRGPLLGKEQRESRLRWDWRQEDLA